MTELDIHLALCRYIKIKDSKVLFSTNYAAGLKLTARQASIQSKLQSHRGAPDLIIYEPRRGYVGLAIELKRENTRLIKKDGSPASEHIKEQDEYLEELRQRGWEACFCIGLDDAINTVNEYMSWSDKVEF